MKLTAENKQLLQVLLLLCLGFFILYLSHIDRGVSSRLITVFGNTGIADFFIAPFQTILYAFFFMALFLLIHWYMKIKLPDADPFILPVVALLSGVGLIMVLRLSPDLVLSRHDALQSILEQNPGTRLSNNTFTLAKLGMKHFIFIATGIVIMVLIMNVLNQRTFSWLSSKKYLWVLLSSVLIIATLVFGKSINGRSLWLFGFQTVELVKLLMICFISGYIYEKGRGIMTYSHTGIKAWMNYAGPFVIMCIFALTPIFIQGDLGPTFLIFVVFLLMFFYAGSPKFVTALFLILIIIGTYISYNTGYPSIVRLRFDMMADPFTTSESISRALWSMASGGIFGTGLGYGQPYRIPAVQSDYSFTAICEEMGFIGGLTVILCYIILIHRFYVITSRAENMYKKALVTGIGMLIGLQALIIILGNMSKIPLTGITLPFVSYGGSSMVVSFLMIGIVLKISGEKKGEKNE